MSAWYNELDPQKAAWLRELMKAGVIADGEVDTRSITEVRADELGSFTQCHFFAGIGVWSYALRLAGWPDDRPVWTGSCPCQPFSVSGARQGGADSRHLWPHWARLIGQCQPATVLGEQVAAAVGHGWFDLVSDDLEAAGYALGAISFPACSVGAPHIRQRLYFVAHLHGAGFTRPRANSRESYAGTDRRNDAAGSSAAGQCAHAQPGRQQQLADSSAQSTSALPEADGAGERVQPASGHGAGAFVSSNPEHAGHDTQGISQAVTDSDQSGERLFDGDGGADLSHHTLSPRLEGHAGDERASRRPGWMHPDEARSVAAADATRGFWADCDWWYGRDGKWRPIEPGVQPLAHGAAARVGRLRGYGDAIVAPQAVAFIKAAMEALP